MADSILISTDELRSAAKNVADLNRQLTGNLEDIKRKLTALRNTWQSESSEEMLTRFNQLDPRFKDYETVVNSYVDFLNKTAEQYEVKEDTIKKNATAIEFK